MSLYRGDELYGTGISIEDLLESKVDLAGDTMTGTLIAPDLTATNVVSALEAKIGNVGTEGSGINIGGVTYESSLKVSDIDGTNYAQTILHRHSTTLEPTIVGARSNSNTAAHADVTNGQGLLSTFGVGYAGSNYKIFGYETIGVDSTGTVSNTSAPGKWKLYVTPNGSTTPALTHYVGNDGVLHGKLRDFVSVKDFGAVGDGVTDDTSAIQAAINYVSNNRKFTLKLNGGTYYLSGNLYLIYDAVLNPAFNTNPLLGGDLSIIGEGKMHRRDFSNDTHCGSVLSFAANKGIIATDAGTTKTWGNRFEDFSIIGNTTGVLFDALWSPTYSVFKSLFIANISNTSNAICLRVGDTWQSTFDDIECIGDKALTTASAGSGFVFTPSTTGAGNNKFYNITSAFFADGLVFGTDYDAAKDVPGMTNFNNTIENCQGQYCTTGLRIKHRISATEIIGYWGELNSNADVIVSDSAKGIKFIGGYLSSSAPTLGPLVLGKNTGTAGVDKCSNITFENVWINCGTTHGVYKYNSALDIKFEECQIVAYGTSAFIATPSGSIGGEVSLINNNYKPLVATAEVSLVRRYCDLSAGVYTDTAWKLRKADFIYSWTGPVTYDMSLWRFIPESIRANTLSGDITLLLPTGLSSSPESVVTSKIYKVASSNNLIIDAGTGKTIRGNQTMYMSKAYTAVELTHPTAAGAPWDISGAQTPSQGNFTLSAAVSTAVADTSVVSTSRISLTPTNAAAATLMSGTKSLYISAKTANTSFTVSTADGTAAAGTETFDYIVNN